MKKLFTIFILLPFFVSAQQALDFTKPIKVTPPSPISYEMSKYGGINTALINGAPNINLPILNYQAKSLSVPISIRYGSAGIKVDQIASRVGMGWDFDGGGVISRIVYDVPDESSTHYPNIPANPTTPSDEAFDFFDVASANNSVDTQPDVYNFSFGGYSGKFIIIDGVVKQIVKSELRIEPGQDGYDFKITAPDGNRYFFGGTGATETSNSESSCDIHRPSYPATAWHLKKIVAYTGETIDFSYNQYSCFYYLGVNESMTRFRVLESEPCASDPNLYPPQLDDQFCASKLKTFYCLLSEISSNVGGLVKFSYVNRIDVPGEYLMSKIRYFSTTDSSTLNRSVLFDYTYSSSNASGYGNALNTETSDNYRAFLSSIRELSSTDELIKKHFFGYNDINSLPPRMSFCQDMLGFFNGKPNLSHIIPKQPTAITNFPPDLADRTFDFAFSVKGTLNSIHYPTGGSDSIVYEPNTVYESVLIPAVTQNISTYGTGTGIRFAQAHSSTSFTPLIAQNALISGYCDFTGDPANYIPNYHFAKIEVEDQTSNQIIYTKDRLEVGESLNDNVALIANHSYILRLTPYGSEVLSSVSLDYKNQESTSVMQNVEMAGIRVQKVITKTSATETADVKRYYYNTPQSGFQNSSGLRNYNPEFYMRIDLAAPCPSHLGPFPVYGVYDGLYSYATNTQYMSQSPVQYQWVAESFGENFANGGITHNFMIQTDSPGETLYGNQITGAPLSNYGIMNGLELKNITYVKKEGNLFAIKSIETHYQESPCNDFSINCIPQPVYGYVVRRNNANIRLYNPHTVEDMQPFNALRYKIMGSWFYADTVKTITYDLNGANPVVDVAVTKYDNTLHSQPTASVMFGSDQKIRSVSYLYPYDLNALMPDLLSPQISALQSLVYSNRISNPVQTVKTVDNAETERSRIDYRDWGASMVLPEFYKIGPSLAGLENRMTFYAYDPNNGNMLSQGQTGNNKSVYIWSYKGQYPIAEIKNSDYMSIETLLGGPTAVRNFTTSMPTDAQIASFLTPLRTSLSTEAQINTFTYRPLVGMTSQTDAKGLTTYYEYDAFGRLKYVKDQNGNILKSNDYHYKN